MIVVGNRQVEGNGWDDAARLSRTARLLRGGSALVPRGVYRYASFGEAETWMTRMMIATHERRSRKTSSASAVR